MPDSEDVTLLLKQWSEGDEAALEQLTPVVYDELRRRARSYLRRERDDHTLQPTALIHEAYMRLVKVDNPDWRSRSHFFAVASNVMRRILVDHARRHRASKRGGGQKVSLDEVQGLEVAPGMDVLGLDQALKELAVFDERKAKIIEMRYFGGCSAEETADALGIAAITVYRESRVAEAWLRRAMTGGDSAMAASSDSE
jgi:RNA polymerase sigma factor (TIGR02999 family)